MSDYEKCPKCNSDLRFWNQKFCTSCGEELKEVANTGGERI